MSWCVRVMGCTLLGRRLSLGLAHKRSGEKMIWGVDEMYTAAAQVEKRRCPVHKGSKSTSTMMPPRVPHQFTYILKKQTSEARRRGLGPFLDVGIHEVIDLTTRFLRCCCCCCCCCCVAVVVVLLCYLIGRGCVQYIASFCPKIRRSQFPWSSPKGMLLLRKIKGQQLKFATRKFTSQSENSGNGLKSLSMHATRGE